MKHSAVVFSLVLGLAVPQFGLAEEEKTEADELFGGGGGYIHPYVTVSGLYDDNVYRTPDNEVSDYATVFSPGIWVAVPGTRERKLNLNTSTLTPGGLGIVEDRGETFRRFQGFLHYGAELTRFQEEDDNDTDDHRIDALLQYSLKGGLTFEAFDMYRDGHDERGEGAFGDLETWKSNLLGGRVSYDLGSRFRVRGEYSQFAIRYDDDANNYLDRTDDKYAGYLYYKLTGKSTIFAEYDLVDISYENLSGLDSKEHTVWGGFRWRLSEKTIGEVKGGYLTKEYDQDGMDDASDFVFKGWLEYELTGKSRLRLSALRIVEEPDANTSNSTTTDMVKLAYLLDVTSKLLATAEAGYGRSEYDGDYSYRGVVGEREDDRYTARLMLDYRIQDWVGAKASYTFVDRDSTFEDLSYTDNRFMLSLWLAM